MNDLLKKLLKKLGYSTEQVDAVANEADDAITGETILARVDELVTASNEHTTTQGQLTTANARVTELEEAQTQLGGRINDLTAEVKAHRNERATLVVANAVTTGRITEAEREGWQSRFKTASNAEAFTAVATELDALEPKLKTEPVTGNLGGRKPEVAAANARQAKLVGAVNARMEKTGEDYFNAYNAVKREQPELFEGMQEPEKLNA